MGQEEKESKLEVVKGMEIPKDVKEKLVETTNKPTPEEIEKFKKDFQDAVTAFDDKKWVLSDPGSFPANDVAMYLISYMEKFAFWSKTEWMGMIKMEEEIKKAQAIANEETGLELGYQALEFCAYMLANPGGTGIELAKEFEAQAEKYSKIGVVVGTHIEAARNELEEMQFLQNRYAASEQGFFYEKEPEEITEEDIIDVSNEVQSELEKKEEKEEK